MNEPPGARARVALTGLTVAEYFRDQEGQDVLLFIDNIFRFTQAGSEVSEELSYKNALIDWLIWLDMKKVFSAFWNTFFILLLGIRLVGPYSIRRGLPADPGHRHGYHAGAYHHNQEGFHHVRAGKKSYLRIIRLHELSDDDVGRVFLMILFCWKRWTINQ